MSVAVFAGTPSMRRGAKRAVSAILSAAGYGFDVERIRDARVPHGKRYRYKFCVYDSASCRSSAARCDADVFEDVRRGQTKKRMAWFDVSIAVCSSKWLYGHRGFRVLSVSTYHGGQEGPVPEPRPICSEGECYRMFVDDLLSGYLNRVLPRLPRISSDEELRLWMATAGV